MQQQRGVELLAPPTWDEYELIDSGDGQKFERFGRYQLIRPESQAIWVPALEPSAWDADAVFVRAGSAGQWDVRRPVEEQWLLNYGALSFWARLTPFRHTGIFPEHMAQWEWLATQIAQAGREVNALVLFGYTGLTTLRIAQAGARVTHVDASKPATQWAQANQQVSGLETRPIRWIIDDVLKYLAREARRGVGYDLIVMDPPAFGRGPKGEVWRFEESFPELIARCVRVLTPRPVGMLVHAYATSISSVALYNVVRSAMASYGGVVSAGELVLFETAGRRFLPTALYARWSAR